MTAHSPSIALTAAQMQALRFLASRPNAFAVQIGNHLDPTLKPRAASEKGAAVAGELIRRELVKRTLPRRELYIYSATPAGIALLHAGTAGITDNG